MSIERMPHEWDDDGCCIHCGFDGAEDYWLIEQKRHERTELTRWCPNRSSEPDDAGMDSASRLM
jgi:hypothetical protein